VNQEPTAAEYTFVAAVTFVSAFFVGWGAILVWIVLGTIVGQNARIRAMEERDSE
jgi:hypothetical protein